MAKVKNAITIRLKLFAFYQISSDAVGEQESPTRTALHTAGRTSLLGDRQPLFCSIYGLG